MVLRVTLEIVPFGDEDRKREIGRLDIFNKGTTDFEEFEYGVIDLTPKQEGLFNKSVYHQRQHGAWILVYRALNDLDIQ